MGFCWDVGESDFWVGRLGLCGLGEVLGWVYCYVGLNRLI